MGVADGNPFLYTAVFWASHVYQLTWSDRRRKLLPPALFYLLFRKVVSRLFLYLLLEE